jgi:AraC-like DNA-binding protein
MSRSRHEPSVRGYAVTHPRGAVALPVERGWDQLLHPAAGVMTVSTATGSWTVPQHRALWLPGAVPATVGNRSRVAVRNLYLRTSLGVLPPEPRAVDLSPFCRELLDHVVRRCPLDLDEPVDAALLTVLADQLLAQPAAPLWLPVPSEPRAAAFADAARRDPAAGTDALARLVGAGRRTLERSFAAETGLALGAWRRRARVLGSLDRLAQSGSVTEAAAAAGYATPSAYVAAFRAELGTTPRRFVSPPPR